jgi:hypothetical protein
LIAAVAAVVVLFVVLSGDDDGGRGERAEITPNQPATATTQSTETERKKPAKPKLERIVVEGGKPRGGVKRLSFERGERVQFVVKSDVADEVHVHGYDVSKDLPAGGSVRFSFPARLEGVFEIELEARHQQIAELRVTPA